MSLKIMAPFNTVDEINDLAETGAGELYCGVIEEEWLRKYPVVGINRRVELFSNLHSFADLKKATDLAHSYGIPVCLTINEHYYTNAQYPYLLDYIAKSIEAGTDAFIVSDPALIIALNEKGSKIPLHLSTGGTVFNTAAAAFYQELGVSRITIPRHLRLAEMKTIIEALPELETAVFIMNSRCANIDGFCTFDHSPLKCSDSVKFLGEGALRGYPEGILSKDIFATGCCMLPYVVNVEAAPSGSATADAKTRSAIARQALWSRHHIDNLPCGACALFDFHKMGVSAVKIVGRGNPTKRKIGDVGFLKMLISLLDGGELERDDFRKYARDLYRANYRKTCDSTNCYYPEMLIAAGREECTRAGSPDSENTSDSRRVS